MQGTAQRAHSLIEVKRINIDERRISGIASTPAADRQGDVLEPEGASFALPFPLLWQHDHGQPIGQVVEARTTPQGIWIAAKVAPEGTSDRIDEAWRLIRGGLVRGLSVGFLGKAWDTMKNGGRRFTSWEVIELSAVTIPANREAEILEVKRADTAPPARSTEREFPRYPHHLTPDERQAVLEKAARDYVDVLVAQSAASIGETPAAFRAKAGRQFLAQQELDAVVSVRLCWLEDRIKHLEGKT